ncbi:hypothetical protein ACQ4M4_14485 [Leptolyngbya sp. AN02str]|uniref:hypothetical protein n=1 Tax=Leptolyngbya sp. AN02str TaxID=3423363 RepID=UPI003D311886
MSIQSQSHVEDHGDAISMKSSGASTYALAESSDCRLQELSQQELDGVAGGLDITLTFVNIEMADNLSAKPLNDGSLSTESSKFSLFSLSAFQISLSGFSSLEHATTFLSRMFGLFR